MFGGKHEPPDGAPDPADAAPAPSPVAAAASATSTIDELKRLRDLRDAGALTPAEFHARRQQLLGDARRPRTG